MSFNPDPLRKAQQVKFSRKVKIVLQAPLTFNNVDVGQICSQNHLEMFLNFKLSFKEPLEKVLAKFDRSIPILQSVLQREVLLSVYQLFICPHFYSGNVIYDQSYNNSFHDKLESY